MRFSAPNRITWSLYSSWNWEIGDISNLILFFANSGFVQLNQLIIEPYWTPCVFNRWCFPPWHGANQKFNELQSALTHFHRLTLGYFMSDNSMTFFKCFISKSYSVKFIVNNLISEEMFFYCGIYVIWTTPTFVTTSWTVMFSFVFIYRMFF